MRASFWSRYHPHSTDDTLARYVKTKRTRHLLIPAPDSSIHVNGHTHLSYTAPVPDMYLIHLFIPQARFGRWHIFTFPNTKTQPTLLLAMMVARFDITSIPGTQKSTARGSVDLTTTPSGHSLAPPHILCSIIANVLS